MSSFRTSAIGVAFASLCAVATVGAAARGEPAPAPAPVYWKQSLFFIPYQINRPATAEDAPLEVRLLVSRDAGANWQTLQTAQPHVKGFTYNADSQDGHYWFAVQTVDRFGREHPAAEIQPELHVVVDTTPPRLEVNAQVNASGEVVIDCRQEDANLDVDKLSVHVQQENGKLEPLQVPEGRGDATNGLVHKITCVPPLGTRTIQVRGETTDLAGNRGIAQIELDLVTARQRSVGGDAQDVAQEAATEQQPRMAGGALPGSTNVWTPAREAAYPQARPGVGSDPRGLFADPPQLAGSGASANALQSTQSWPVDRTTASPPVTASADPKEFGAITPEPLPATNLRSVPARGMEQLPPPPIAAAAPAWSVQQTSTPLGGQVAGAGPSTVPGGTQPENTFPAPAQNAATQSGPHFAGQASPITPVEEIGAGDIVHPAAGGTGSLAGYPDTGAPKLNMIWAGEAPSAGLQSADGAEAPGAAGGWQMVGSRTIAIDYEVASVGPWGVSAVELWGTRDGGQSWRRYAVDDDNRSPVTATVEGEGEYGFKVLVHSAGGFAAAPPAQGDAPEALVRVDLVRPEATLDSVEQGTGNLADQIMIRWSASDAHLAPQPVTLYYSAQPAGPWSIIAAGLVNSGSYAWRADRHLPEQLYVRLEVRDAAGNTTTYQTAQPVVVNRPRPQVRIREIRSFDAAAVQSGNGP
jgi:hypothetical protein